jgi:hypothetical protein
MRNWQQLRHLGEDLARSPESIKSPDWHEEILDERRQQIADGNARFDDWETAKVEIRNKVSSILSLITKQSS